MKTQVNVELDSRWVDRIRSPFWGLVTALGPPSMMFLAVVGTDRIFDTFQSEGNTLTTWIYAVVGVLCLLCSVFSICVTMEVCRSIALKDKQQKGKSQPSARGDGIPPPQP